MARVTVEDCIDKLPNRYELVLVAAQRAKDISAGSMITVDRDNDKNSVVALREISENRVSIEDLQESLVKNQQKLVEIQEPEDEEVEIIDSFFENAPVDMKPLWYLSKSLELLSEADAAYFVDGWNSARGCNVEHVCAATYGIEIIYD